MNKELTLKEALEITKKTQRDLEKLRRDAIETGLCDCESILAERDDMRKALEDIRDEECCYIDKERRYGCIDFEECICAQNRAEETLSKWPKK